MYVSLDTVRDYLFVDDCAELILASMARARAETEVSGVGYHTKILASQRPIAVGAVIGELRRVLRQQPKIIYSRSPLTALQARDLRMRSVVWPDLDQRPLTPLPVGIQTTIDALSRSMQIGALT
jgi:UDP-glucose 4-epimerase